LKEANMPSMRRPATGGLVYSTEGGRKCPTCRQATADCRCGQPAVPPGDGIVRVSRETQGRGGKAVTLVRGVPLQGEALAALGKRLRAACGAGGTLKDGVLEVQGEHRDRVVELLLKEGFRVKKSGG
jgi:translation initiation factor 1